jgi:DNA invertase Pin-like site-specific DNA recombinase
MPAKKGKPADDRCGIYCRQSDPGQSTLPDQEKWGRRVAETNAWPIAVVALDDGLSGDDLTRPGLAKIEAAWEANFKAGCPIGRLLVPKTDRLSRSDSLDAFELLARLRRWGLRYVVTTDRTIDLHNRLDRTLYALEQDHSNNPFLATMAERSLNGSYAVVQEGFWVGRIPLGYKLVKKPGEHGAGKRRRSGRLVIDPETGPLVLELFERYAAGESTVDLARWLTAQIGPRQKALAWSAESVRDVLMNDVYIGVRGFGRRSQGKHVRLGPGGAVPQEPGRGEDNLEAAFIARDESLVIVSENLFRRVQARLATGRGRGYHKATQPLPLSGLGKCACCGGPLHARLMATKSRRRDGKPIARHLVCGTRARFGRDACPNGSAGCRHDDILAAIFELLADTLLKDGAAERLTRLAEERADEAERQVRTCREALLRRVADLDGKLVRAQRRLAEVDPDMLEDCQAGIRQMRQERAEAEAEVQRLDAQQTQAAEIDPGRFRAFWETCRRAYDLFRATTEHPPSLRPLLAELIEGFTVHWGRDKRGRVTPARVDVELPRWLTALASNGLPA